jgi:hypothetical protein
VTEVRDVLDRLAAIGAFAEVRGDRLVLRAGHKAVPADLVRELRRLRPKVLPALASRSLAEARDWCARHQESLRFWAALYPEHEALGIAWGEMQWQWRKRHWEPTPKGVCAGCDQPLGSGPVLPLDQGNVVHIAMFDCVIAYGERWRGVATRALKALGLVPPPEDK